MYLELHSKIPQQIIWNIFINIKLPVVSSGKVRKSISNNHRLTDLKSVNKAAICKATHGTATQQSHGGLQERVIPQP